MYDDFYGLAGRPFQLTPDPAFYFESATHRKALSYLSYGIAEAEGFVVITGEIGAGKSTLVAHLMATVDRGRLTAAQIALAPLDGGDVLVAVARAFGVDLPATGHGAHAQAFGAIEAFLHEEARAGRRCLLVVDEVQTLPLAALESLRLLSNLHLGRHPLLQIVLLGQPEFRTRLQTEPELEQLRQRVIAAHHLDAMAADEIEPYVLHRLRQVGWQGRPAFEPRLFAELHAATGGVPRRINQIAGRLLLLGAVEQRERIDALMLADVLAELNADALGPVAALAQPDASRAPAPHDWQAPAAPQEHSASLDLHAAFAERDAQIAELQQAVIELANSDEMATAAPPADDTAQEAAHAEHRAGLADHRDALAALAARLAALEARPAPATAPELAAHEALVARVAAAEARVDEMEQMLRHTLTMLIEWIEREEDLRAAA